MKKIMLRYAKLRTVKKNVMTELKQTIKSKMKRSATIALILFSLFAKSQNRTNIWELGYQDTLIYPNCEMRYSSGTMDTNSLYRIMAFFTTDASICDTNGFLLFYSNGLTIGDRNHDTLQNAVDFNPGFATDFYEPDGMGIDQGVLIIPYPDHSNLYYIFSVSAEILPTDIQPLHLSYSVIDMNLDGGLGGIVDTLKNIHAIEDTLTLGGLTAVKHANGRDWWIIARSYHSNQYYKLLITPTGIEGPFSQNLGSVINSDTNVQATFSPDGSKFCFSTFTDECDYMFFDRCTGNFSNPITIHSPDSIPDRGNSFSPNNRFLYISTLFNLYQYDTWDSNMVANVIHLATWDTFYDGGIPVYFFMQQLAPDGKIYMSAWNGVKYINVINSPDSIGIGSNFTPHSYVLPTWTGNIPSFPNYDLGSLEGSPCDTLATSQGNLIRKDLSIRLFPNPSSSLLNIEYQSVQPLQMKLFDITGEVRKQMTLYPYFRNRLLRVEDLPEGIYLAVFTLNNQIVKREKVSIVRE